MVTGGFYRRGAIRESKSPRIRKNWLSHTTLKHCLFLPRTESLVSSERFGVTLVCFRLILCNVSNCADRSEGYCRGFQAQPQKAVEGVRPWRLQRRIPQASLADTWQSLKTPSAPLDIFFIWYRLCSVVTNYELNYRVVVITFCSACQKLWKSLL